MARAPIDDVDALLEATLKDPNALNAPRIPEVKPYNYSQDHEKEREREKEKDNGKGQEREKERERDKDREGRSRKRSREREDRDHDRKHRSRSRSRERRRRRSRSRSRGRHSRRDESQDKDRDRDRRRREEEREKQRAKEALLSPAERAAVEADRDSRTVFGFNLPLRAYEEDIEKFFESRAGKVRDIRLITDRITRKPKGFGYIEFFDKASVPAAIAMSGSQFLGQTIQVQMPQAEKNRMANPTNTTTTVIVVPTKIYINNLHPDTSEEDLRRTFQREGDVEYVNLVLDAERRPRGFAFVQFRRSDDAKRAQHEWNGREYKGRVLKVQTVTDKQEGIIKGKLGGGELDDDETRHFVKDSQSRTYLMQKLAEQRQSPPHSTSPVRSAGPSPCIVLKNMFDPSSETEPNWDEDIKNDVREECKKFGSVLHVYVDKNSQGFVYMKLGSINAATSTINALNGRWFAGRQLAADYMSESTYHDRFPDSKKV